MWGGGSERVTSHLQPYLGICLTIDENYGIFPVTTPPKGHVAECVWNLMAHGDAREGKWWGNWRMKWVANHTTSEHGVSSITNADAHTSAASSRLNWRPRRFKWNRPFRRKTKSGFCACAITFQTQSKTERPVWRPT